MKHTLMPTLALVLAGLAANVLATPPRIVRDPFVSRLPASAPLAAAAPVPATPPRLRAVVLNGAQSLANLDGSVVATGERVAGYTVLRIDARGVLLGHAGSEHLLTMQDKDAQ
ncbi:hypothetical protein HD842_003215 [Massilia aurea]|uniref:MSHA biogenesis protein MshK n=1 Tax=Massilia aurea TaxID=373040 RepID=A0A7X0CFG1_9BURK|nr:hypothetical protein [Massilia aurea]MBB6135057.1 hypothetical protein [Massilia aurea]